MKILTCKAEENYEKHVWHAPTQPKTKAACIPESRKIWGQTEPALVRYTHFSSKNWLFWAQLKGTFFRKYRLCTAKIKFLNGEMHLHRGKKPRGVRFWHVKRTCASLLHWNELKMSYPWGARHAPYLASEGILSFFNNLWLKMCLQQLNTAEEIFRRFLID